MVVQLFDTNLAQIAVFQTALPFSIPDFQIALFAAVVYNFVAALWVNFCLFPFSEIVVVFVGLKLFILAKLVQCEQLFFISQLNVEVYH